MKALRWALFLGLMIPPSILSAGSLVNGTFDASANPIPDSLNPDAGLWGWSFSSPGVMFWPFDFFDNASPDGFALVNADIPVSSLSQDFDVTTADQSIRFQFKPMIDGGGIPETDHFKVYLWQLDETNTPSQPLIAVDPYEYFYHWSTDTMDTSESAANVQVEKLRYPVDPAVPALFMYYQITVPISYNGKVRLEFQLETDYEVLIETTIAVDNVVIVPEETASYSGVALTINSPFATGLNGTASVPIHAQLVDEQNNPIGILGVPVTIIVTSLVLAQPWSPATTPVTTGDGMVDVLGSFVPGVYTATATVSTPQGPRADTTIFVVYNPAERGFVTGGGWIVSNPLVNPQRANFGFEAKYQKGVPSGHLEFRFTDGSIDLKSESINYLVVAAPYAWFAGWARAAHGSAGYWFFVTVQDRSKSGSGDYFNIDIWAPGTDLFGDPFLSAGNNLDGGNIVIHSK